MLHKDERFDPRLAAHDEHRHRAEHEAGKEGGEEGQISEKLAEQVFAGTHRGRGRDHSATRDAVASDRIRDHVIAKEADEHHTERRRAHADRAGIIDRAVTVDLDQSAAGSGVRNPDICKPAKEEKDDQRGRPAEAQQEIRAHDGDDASRRFSHRVSARVSLIAVAQPSCL